MQSALFVYYRDTNTDITIMWLKNAILTIGITNAKT